MLEPFSTHFCESPGRRKSSVDSTMAVVWETRDGRFCVVVVAEKLARAQSPRPWPWWRHRQSKQSHTAQIRWSTLTWTNSGSQPGHLRTTAPNLGGSSLLLISLHLTSWNILGLECYSIMHNAFFVVCVKKQYECRGELSNRKMWSFWRVCWNNDSDDEHLILHKLMLRTCFSCGTKNHILKNAKTRWRF